MIWLFVQTWVWQLAAFVLGSALTWWLVTRARRDGGAGRARPSTPAAAPSVVDVPDQTSGLRTELRAAERQVAALATEIDETARRHRADLGARDREMALLRARLVTTTFAEPTPRHEPRQPATAPPAAGLTEPINGRVPVGRAAETGPTAELELAPSASTPLPGQAAAPTTARPTAPTPTPAPAVRSPDPDTDPDEHRDDLDTDLAGVSAPLPDGSAPDGYAIKGEVEPGIYHLPGSPGFDEVTADVWFANEADARAAGFEPG